MTPSRTSASFLADASRNTYRHTGELVASFGSVVQVREAEGSTVFQLATPNYAYVFEVTFPGEVPDLDKGHDAMFLGTIRGAVASADVNSGKILLVDGLAVVPYGKKAVLREDQRDLAQSWLDKKLDVSAGGGGPAPLRRPAVAELPQAPAAATAMGAAPAYAQAPRPEPAATDLKTLLKHWAASSGEAKAKMRELLERWGTLPDEEKTLFADWNSMSEEDKTLFRQLVTDSGSR